MRKEFTKAILLLLFLFTGSLAYSQDIPDKPVPPRLVNDFAGLLNAGELSALEQKLDLFNDSTSVQIAIVIVKSLNGYPSDDYAQRLAEKWGIGQKGLNNGALILVKPKTAGEQGKVFISTGYGIEGAIPDLLAAQIVDREMLPSFRTGNYYEGIDKAVNAMMALARREFSPDDYMAKEKKHAEKAPGGLLVFIIVIVLFIIIASSSSGGSNNRHISSKGLPFWMLMSMLNSGRGSGGSWGGFSGGGGGGFSGGGGGGFGGFGGGSFGGGGAGGSW